MMDQPDVRTTKTSACPLMDTCRMHSPLSATSKPQDSVLKYTPKGTRMGCRTWRTCSLMTTSLQTRALTAYKSLNHVESEESSRKALIAEDKCKDSGS